VAGLAIGAAAMLWYTTRFDPYEIDNLLVRVGLKEPPFICVLTAPSIHPPMIVSGATTPSFTPVP